MYFFVLFRKVVYCPHPIEFVNPIIAEFEASTGIQANFAAAMATIMVIITAVLFMGQKYVVNKKPLILSGTFIIMIVAFVIRRLLSCKDLLQAFGKQGCQHIDYI